MLCLVASLLPWLIDSLALGSGMLPRVFRGMLVSAVIIKKNSSNCHCSPCKILIGTFRFGVNGKSVLTKTGVHASVYFFRNSFCTYRLPLIPPLLPPDSWCFQNMKKTVRVEETKVACRKSTKIILKSVYQDYRVSNCTFIPYSWAEWLFFCVSSSFLQPAEQVR